MSISEKNLNKALLKTLSKKSLNLGNNDELFIKRVYGGGLSKYIDRLLALDFTGKQRVLDFGCGYGQWTLALANLNENVSSCDVSQQRVSFVENLTSSLNISNLDIRSCENKIIPYEDSSFDGVFSYSVLPVAPWRELLAEFYRVLRPNGILYVNANAVGWYSFLWMEEHNKADDYDPKKVAARAYSDTLRYDRNGIYEPGMNLIIEPKQMIYELEKLGFTEIKIASEGGLHIDPAAPRPIAFLKGDYFGQTAVFEVVSSK